MRPRAPALLLVVATSSAIGCRSPTEITVDVRTDVPCTAASQWHGVAIYAGAPGLDVESKPPALTTAQCDGSGHVGSVVLVPSASKDDPVGVRVVAGLTRAPEDCAAHGYDGCIVARRELRFIPHESLSIVVDLAGGCLGQACDALHTCLNGTCADSRLVAPPPGEDAGPSGPVVRCGDDGVTCPANDIHHACCVTIDKSSDAYPERTKGACVESTTCNSPSVPVLCDKNSDCAGELDDAGLGYLCVADWDGSSIRTTQCLPRTSFLSQSGEQIGMCNDKQPCLGTKGCDLNNFGLPGYFTCVYN